MNFTPEEREAYEGHLKFLRGEANALKKAEQKGIAIGLEKGIEKGKINTAQNMLADNFDIEVIAKITGLSVEQIKPLRQ